MSEVPQSVPSLSRLDRPRNILQAVLLFCLCVIPFLPALHGEFLWDDQDWLQNNMAVHAWNGLITIWNPFVQGLHFYPMTFTTFWIEHKIWGLDTTGYHLINMIIHACGALMLWRILDRLGLRAAWLAALLWAIHPVQVDSVDWIAERKNTLSGIFYFLAVWSWLRFEGFEKSGTESAGTRDRWHWYAAALLCFIAGLLSKTVICTLPAALALILWWKRGKLSVRQVVTLALLLVVGLGIAIFTAHQERWVIVNGGTDNLIFTPLQRIVIAGRDVWFYLRTLLLPYPLMAIYPRWDYGVTSLVNVAAPLAVLAVLAALFILRNRIGRGPLVAFIFFLITLSPALGFINFYTMHFSFVADHYQYLACIGILAFLAEMLLMLVQRVSSLHHRSALIVASAIVLTLAPLTAFYATLYRTKMNLWSWNVAQNPAAFTAQHNLGVAYMNAGDFTRASEHISIAVTQAPDDDFIQVSYGRICRARGDFAQAISHFKIAINLLPTSGENYIELGKTYQQMGMTREALREFATAVKVDGEQAEQHVTYAAALARVGESDKAVAEYKSALLLDPGNLIVRYNYANLLLDLKHYPEAIDQYQSILQNQEKNPLVWHNLAAAYYESGQNELALAAKKRANDLDAQFAPTPMPAPATAPAPASLPAAIP